MDGWLAISTAAKDKPVIIQTNIHCCKNIQLWHEVKAGQMQQTWDVEVERKSEAEWQSDEGKK